MKEQLFWITIALFILWNFITFVMMGLDKHRAKKGAWRISEKALLLSSFFFGGIGGFFGMRVFHHKTKHWYFKLLMPFFGILQVILLLYFVNIIFDIIEF